MCVHLWRCRESTSSLPLQAAFHLGAFEKAGAVFLFIDFLLSILACVFAVRAVDEVKDTKRSDERERLRGSAIDMSGQGL